MVSGQLENGERLGDIVLGPTGELRCCVFVGVEEPIEFCLSIGCVFGIEDVSDVVGNLLSHADFRCVLHGVLCEVELTSLPWDGRQDGFASCLESGVIVADDKLDSLHSSLAKRLQEVTPVDFGFGQRDADAEHRSMSAGEDSDGDQDGTVSNRSIDTDFLVSCVENEVLDLSEFSVAPLVEFVVEAGSGTADLCAGDIESTQFGSDFSDLPRRDTLDIHFRDSQFQSSFTSFSSFECGGIELAVASLRHLQHEFSDPGVNRLWFESISVGPAIPGSLVGSGAQVLGSFDFHRFIDEQLHCLRHSVKAVLRHELV